MKTLFKSLLVAFTLTVVTFSTSWAESNKPIGKPKNAAAFQSSLYTTAEGKLQIALDKQTGGSVVVRLKNSAGTDLFIQQIGKRQQVARMRLDVSALPDGVYQVVISNGVETTTQELTLATQQPSATARLVAFN
ncbi:hypothetical protein GCM10028803_54490 [Larkinella knui]|uniref:T9SS C-terminal target domain-containing protein n=1 Tax=Larkinella knui TaxID=2025310 RepID=A0A3P1CGN6_9BACT|nr:hypothetical protein [Larkinella knui]RRB12348.1 hypothetical protein EHT87_19300 [Larkinella knui]